MKIDMHCHTKEGSIDAKVSIEQYIKKLISNGFDGMLVTDHNSYDGYRKFKEIADRLHLDKPFAVLKGIEYDTRDAGHVIAVLPDHISETFLEIRGMTVVQLERLVHAAGGILGPAHPYGTGYFAFANTKFGRRNMEFIHKFDFIETFNACTRPIANLKADLMANRWKKPKIAGSDAHKEHIVGAAYTIFDSNIANNNDLIQAIRSGAETIANGNILQKMCEKNNKVIEKLGVIGYWIYNKLGALLNHRKLKKVIHKQHFLNLDK